MTKNKAPKKVLPKVRNILHKVLAAKATSNAAGKHKESKKSLLKESKKIDKLLEEHLY
jgi:hypothetical protein